MTTQELLKRTFDFASSTGQLAGQLADTLANRAYLTQLLRSTAAVGMNYRFAQHTRSGENFEKRLQMMAEEAEQSIYFLQLLVSLNQEQAALLDPLINEATEIVKIASAAVNTVSKKKVQAAKN